MADAHGHARFLFQSFQNMVKPFIGAGILALPGSFAKGGVLASSILVVILAFVSNYGMRCLLEAAEALRAKKSMRVESFADVGYGAYGPRGAFWSNVILVSSQIGFCIAYIAFISANLHDVFGSVTRIEWLLIATPLIMLLCQVRQVERLAFSSFMGNVIYMYTIATVFYYGFSKKCCVSVSEAKWVSWSGLPFVFGTASFALEGIGTVMPLEKSLGRRKHYFWPLLNSAMVFVVACYLSFAILGYLFFGEDTQAPISNNLSEGHLGDSVKLTLSLSLYFTYAIQMFPVSDLCDEAIASRMGILAGSSAVEEKSRLLTAAAEQEVSAVGGVSGGPSVSDPLSSGGGGASDAEGGGSGALHHGGHVGADILSASATPAARSRFLLFTSLARVGLVLVTAVISGIFANFGVIVSLVGAVSVSALAYIMPMLVHLKLCIPPGGHTWRTSAPQIVIIVVGVLASISNLYFAIRDI